MDRFAGACPLRRAPGRHWGATQQILFGVSCGSPGSCVAVGSYLTKAWVVIPYVDVLANGLWTAMAAPMPSASDGASGTSSNLTSVECMSVSWCIVIGTLGLPDGTQAFADVYSDGTWTSQSFPLQGGPWISLSCAAVGSCTVAENESGVVYLLSLDDGAWSLTTAPVPDSLTTPEWGVPFTLSCPEPGSCVAAGFVNYQAAPGSWVSAAVIETQSPTGWTSQVAPTFSGWPNSQFSSVSCGAVGACVAVGASWPDDTGLNAEGLIDTLNDGSWTSAEAPTSPATPNMLLNGVACPSAESCDAYGIGGIVDLSDGVWTTQADPLPGNASGPSSVDAPFSCPGPGDCAAVGNYANEDGVSLGMFLQDPSLPETTTAVTARSVPMWFASLTTVSAHVASGSTMPRGTVTFTTGNRFLCRATLVLGRASCATIAAPVGTDRIVASYSGTQDLQPSVGTTLVVVPRH
jgi:hypothetical protein